MGTQRVTRAWAMGVALALAGATTGCSLKESASGEACERSAQCAEGLACVMGKCSGNIDSIAKQSTVPDLGLGDASASDAASDASKSSDAAAPVGNDGSVQPGSDASNPQPGSDASQSGGPDASSSLDDAG